ncbi:VanZ family protein [Loigolactobacillus jiayinensis]|uniref:VanZ family protein n=1 Tax=Loigolactobacillus jiayinensis TaxID=2486016 RepID=A0ABW1RGU9_9LACO|nr:VanZ family protein [Loigolactobacillus jiayinensis]
MHAYLYPIKIALLVFPVLALGITIPFLVRQYRKYGALTGWQAFVLYTFVFYLLTAYFLVVLPLPPRHLVALYTSAHYNLEPLMFVREFMYKTVLQWRDPQTYLPALKQAAFVQPTFNVILTIPFGAYLRYYFRRSFPQTVALSFALTLFFETTQLSGLYGIYPRPYRLFDVDDLMLNTLGGIIGFGLAPFLTQLFPTSRQMIAAAFAKGRRVSFSRRFVAFVIDWLCLLILTGIVSLLSRHLPYNITANLGLWYGLEVLGYFVLLPGLWQGATLGKRLVKIKITAALPVPLRWWQLIWRQVLLYGAVVPTFIVPILLLNGLSHAPQAQFDYYLMALLVVAVVLAIFCLHALLTMLFRRDRLFYERLSHTKEVSTVELIHDETTT